LIEKINNIANNCNNIPISDKIEDADSMLINGKDTSYISFNGYTGFHDTIYKFDKVRKRETKTIDTIYYHKYPNIDTIYVSNNKQIPLRISARKYFNNEKITYCDCVTCYIRLSWKNDSSFVKLNYIYTSNCYGMFKKVDNKTEKSILLDAFEKEIISHLKK
jgi:hypothetical protein